MDRPIIWTLHHDWIRASLLPWFLNVASFEGCVYTRFFGRNIFGRLWFRELSPPLVQRGGAPTSAFYDAPGGLARFTMFPNTLLFTLRDSFTDCIETFSATRVFLHNITYHSAASCLSTTSLRYFMRRSWVSSWNRYKRDFRLMLTIDTGRQLNSLQEYRHGNC